MYFKEIELESFRNYKKLKLSFDEHLNLILGNNAQGKTNLLEALFIMSIGKSFRSSSDKEMISFGENMARAKTLVIDEDFSTSIEICYIKQGKMIKVDDIPLERVADLLEHIYIVIFSPEDLKIIKEGPESRRRFLDRELCQLKPVYYSDLGNYKRLLRQRNMLLRQNCKDKDLLYVFDESLSDYGLRIIKERSLFIQKLQKISQKIHRDISGNTETLNLSYESKFEESQKDLSLQKEEYKELLQKNLESDLQKGYTSIGPHKDDLKISLNQIDARIYASQGQQRSAALSLKLAETELIKEQTGKNPVLLLDDVLSELDQNRQRYLIESMKNLQIFITATELDEKLQGLLPLGKTFYVKDGNILT